MRLAPLLSANFVLFFFKKTPLPSFRDAIKECEGLEGERLEACYASFGCDVIKITDHYSKAAGLNKDKKKDVKA